MKPELQSLHHLDEVGFGHLVAFYYYAYTPLQLPAGLLIDSLGPRRVLASACFLCAVATAWFASTTMWVGAALARFLMGAGSAFAYVGVLKLAALWLPQRYFSLVAAVCSALGLLGGAVGLTASTYVTHRLGWQEGLWGIAGLGVVLALALSMLLMDGRTSSKKKQSEDFMDWRQLCQQLSALFRSRFLWTNGLIGAIAFLPISVFAELWAVPYLESVYQCTRETAANWASLSLLGFAVGGPFWGMVSEYWKSRVWPLCLGTLLSAFCFLALLMPGLPPTGGVMEGLLFGSAFFAGAEILIFTVAQESLPPSMTGTGAAFTNMVVMLGGVLLQPLFGMLVAAAGYEHAMSLLPLCLILASVMSVKQRETCPKGETHVLVER